jgi:chitinase
MDWIHVMTYDYTGTWATQATHNAPLHPSSKVSGNAARSIERTINYLRDERKFPSSRIVLGLPLYGRGFAVGEPYASTAGAPKSKFDGDYSRLHALLSGGDWQRRWDDETKTPWLVADDGTYVIGYDDEESLALKTTWAMDRGLRGVFFWEISADRLDDGSTPLQQVAHDAWVAGARRTPN